MKVLVILLIISIYAAPVKAQKSQASVKQYGAYANGLHDDTQAIINAIKNASVIVLPKGVYLVTHQIRLSDLTNKTIVATGATIINNNPTLGTVFFNNCKNISINGGLWKRTPGIVEGKGDEHTFTFADIVNLTVKNVEINSSPEMGIALVNVINAKIVNNKIFNCYRDGIYAHYSANIVYYGNYLENIKDDALSIHDYGIDSQKTFLFKMGIKQAGHSKIIKNYVKNAYQGFASIGCTDLLIQNNIFVNTVNAGIAIRNSETTFKGSTSRAANIDIDGNVLQNNNGAQIIMGKKYTNSGQLTTGRAAIFVGATDENDLINSPHTMLHEIKIVNNKVNNGFTNGLYAGNINSLYFKNNSFTNCNRANSPYCGLIVEIENSTDVITDGCKITDTRRPPLHKIGYALKNVTGKMANWKVKGYLSAPFKLMNFHSTQ